MILLIESLFDSKNVDDKTFFSSSQRVLFHHQRYSEWKSIYNSRTGNNSWTLLRSLISFPSRTFESKIVVRSDMFWQVYELSLSRLLHSSKVLRKGTITRCEGTIIIIWFTVKSTPRKSDYRLFGLTSSVHSVRSKCIFYLIDKNDTSHRVIIW